MSPEGQMKATMGVLKKEGMHAHNDTTMHSKYSDTLDIDGNVQRLKDHD